jgi:ribose-phosphate pyrophosphokinase
MTLLILSLPGNERMAESIDTALNDISGRPKAQAPRSSGRAAERGVVTMRRFPDGETYVRVETSVRGRDVAIVCTLDRPDDKLLPLFFLAATARDLGAASVGLVAPYLAYMRQDRRFAEGEGITSAYFASLLSRSVDWLVTVDPHLHRRASLGEVYTIPAEVVHAAPKVADWIRSNVRRPLLIGPDSESAQWIAAVAAAAGAPSIVLEKTRKGDRDVSVTVPDVERWRDHTPVLVDDIISTAKTMIETVRHLGRTDLARPVCVGVHAVFAPAAYDELQAAGAAMVVTCNTISHASNVIDMSGALADAVAACAAITPSMDRD